MDNPVDDQARIDTKVCLDALRKKWKEEFSVKLTRWSLYGEPLSEKHAQVIQKEGKKDTIDLEEWNRFTSTWRDDWDKSIDKLHNRLQDELANDLDE